ncbi:MAG: glycosyltransferase family 2 protein [Maricaulaceae bacterium]|jgi:glycosyltransferase involved in cell wall biosynthesis
MADTPRKNRAAPGQDGDAPTVSAVTICFNAKSSIARTIASVQAQTHPSVEHVIVDGGSTDGTVELARGLLRPGDRIVSEADEGISDALNKGVALARGRYVHFIHADDHLTAEFYDVAVNALEETGAPFVFGDLVMERGGKPAYTMVGEPLYASIIPRRMPNLNHPTCVVRKEIYDQVGGFDLKYRCAMDYDWFLRAAKLGLYGRYEPHLVAHMNVDGVSNNRFGRTIAEVRRIAVSHGRPPLLAWPEWAYRITKSSIGRVVRERAEPLYLAIRKIINPTIQERTQGR